MSPTVFITGANSGIGLATARLFVDRGWNVIATTRSELRAAALRELEAEHASRMLITNLDLGDGATLQPAIDAGLGKFGRIDVLINNAGYGQHGIFEMLTMDQVRRQFEVNVFGTLHLTHLLLPHFRTAPPTSPQPIIITITSGAGHIGLPLSGLYGASKAALNLFFESISYELLSIPSTPPSRPIYPKIICVNGVVADTSFVENAMPHMGLGALAQNPEMAGAYGQTVRTVMAALLDLAKNSMPVVWVAEKIWQAATDGKTQLRYFVSPKQGKSFLDARMEGVRGGESVDEADVRYMEFMLRAFVGGASGNSGATLPQTQATESSGDHLLLS